MYDMKIKQRGFTLVELVMTLVLISIISVVATKLLSQGYKAYITAKSVSETDWQGLLASSMLANDLQLVRASNDISSAQASAITFVDATGTSIQYQLSGTTLLRNS